MIIMKKQYDNEKSQLLSSTIEECEKLKTEMRNR